MKNGKTATVENYDIRTEENLQQILLDALPCMALIMKPATKEVVAANRNAREWGFVAAQKGRIPCFWRILPDERTGRCEQQYEFELDGLLWDLRWVPVHDDYYLFYAFDISDRRRSERVYRNTLKSLEGYRKLFTQMPEAAFIVSPEGVILDINEAASKQLGYRKPELVGQPVTLIYESAAEGSFREDSTVRNREVVIRTKDNQLRTVLLNTSQVCGEDGKVIHTVSLQNDITDIKRHEAETQRGRKLESLGHLAGGIAHDFNNLLGGIYGYIDLAGAKTEDERVVKYLGKALGTIERAKTLTRQLLTFAKGGAPVKRVDRLFPLVKDRALAVIGESGIGFECTVEDGLWQCECDRNQISQAVDNLVTNAVQAMSQGGSLSICAENVTIEAREHLTLDPGNYIRIVIRDTGTGIPPVMLPHLFDPFYSTKPKSRGLGLAMSYSIITRHGGCIDVESKPGEGCVFTIHLPAALKSVTMTSPSQDCFAAGGTMIVVDDEEFMRETMCGMLVSLGFTVVEKEDGKDALDYFVEAKNRGENVAGFIVDLTIPGGMGGRETVTQLRDIDKSIPVIVSSGYAEDPVMADPTRFGFTASISKPFRRSDLRRLLSM